MADQTARRIQPAQGKLGVLCVGLGAVATTFIAGVENVRRGAAKPIGSITQMGTIRLGKRTEGRAPLIRDFVPLADLKDLVFGAWDPVPDDAYAAALHAGVLDRHEHLEPIAAFLKAITPMPAVFDQNYVKRLEGKNVKTGKTKRELAEALRKDIRDFKAKHGCDRLVMVWCASTEIFISPGPAHWTLEAFEKAMDANDPTVAPSMLYAYAALHEGVPFANGAPNLTCDFPAMEGLAKTKGVPIGGKDFKTGQTMVKTVLAPMFKARMLGVAGWYSTNILGNRDGEVLDDPESFKTKEESKLGVLEYILQPAALPRAVRRDVPQGADQLLPAAGGQQGGLGQHRHLRVAGLPDADQGRFPVPGLHPRRPAGARSGAVLRPGAARGSERHPGVALVLLQEPAGGARIVPGARPVHPADQAQEHAPVPDGRGADHPFGHRILPERLMKYFYRTHATPEAVLVRATAFFGARLAPVEEQPRRRRFSGTIGQIGVTVQAEGGHYMLVTVETNQVGESEADKLAKRFLTVVHTMDEPTHRPIGAY